MKRFFALFLCGALLLGGLYIPTAAVEEPEDVFFYEDASPAQAVENAVVSYDENHRAIRIAAQADGTASATVDMRAAVGNSPAADGQLNLVLWAPATNQKGKSLDLTCGEWNDTCNVTAGHRYELYTFDGATGDSFTMAFDAAAGDSMYLFAAGGSTGYSADTWNAVLKSANGHTFTEEELFLDKYEVERYTKPYWDETEKIVYNESFFVLANEDGTIDPIQLMYDADRIVSVQDSYLNKEYVYGVDYTIEDGKLVILPDGGIFPWKYSYVFSNNKYAGWWEMLDGGYVYGGQFSMFMTGYLNVTYTYKDATQSTPKPEAKGYLLDKTLTKLEGGETVKIFTVGDSIAGGANCSGALDPNPVEPYADIWHEMAAKKLQLQYPDATIEYDSIYQGGASADLCIEKMEEILQADPDLLIIEFGVNECMAGDPASIYIETLQQAIASVRENLPDCDIILISPLVSNPYIFPTEWFDTYADALYTLEQEGVAVADVTSMMRAMLSRKRYLDMTGDNLCHPNDFVSRLFAQILVATLSRDENVEDYSRRLEFYRSESEYYPEQWKLVQALIEEGSSAILDCASSKDAAAKLLEYKEKIREIPTKKQVDANAELDPAKLIYSTNRAMDAVSDVSMVNKKYDASDAALVATVSGVNPIITFDYTAGSKPVMADDYTHLVLTIKASTKKAEESASVQYKMKGTEEGSQLDLESIAVPLTLDGKYHSYILDLTQLDGWTGEISSMAMKLFAKGKTNDSISFSSLILCESEEQAQKVGAERERIANKEPAPAVTRLFDSDESAAAIAAEITYVRGDVDNDGIVTPLDALEMAKYLAGADAQYANLWRLDVDLDGEVLALDAHDQKMIIAGVAKEETAQIKTADVSFEASQDAAKIATLEGDAAIEIDVSGLNCSADVYKYLTLCLKTANGKALDATVTMITDTGSSSADISFVDDTMFQAGSCEFASISGAMQKIYITFHNAAEDIIYLDSYVFTATQAAAKNAEIVRVGAANLI